MTKIKKSTKKVIQKAKAEAEFGARRAVLEDLFYDFHSSRRRVYTMNFFRGIFFGVGSVIGGTLVVALIIGVLSWLAGVTGGFGTFIQYIVDIVRQS